MTPSPDKPVERPQKAEVSRLRGERPSPAALFANVRERVGATRSKLGGVLTSLSRAVPNVDLSPERAEFAQQEHELADLNAATAQRLGVEQDSQQTDDAPREGAGEKSGETMLAYNLQLQKLNKIKGDIANGTVSDEVREFWRGCVRDVDGRFEMYKNMPSMRNVYYGKQDTADLQNPNIRKYLDATVKTREAILHGLQEGKFHRVHSQDPHDPRNIEAFKNWLIELQKQQFYKDFSEAGKINRPTRSGFDDQLVAIQEKLIELDALGRSSPIDQHIQKIGEFYHVAMTPNKIFTRVNQSLFMNMVNGMLEVRGLKPVEHGMLDFTAQRFSSQPEKFNQHFREEVKHAQEISASISTQQLPLAA